MRSYSKTAKYFKFLWDWNFLPGKTWAPFTVFKNRISDPVCNSIQFNWCRRWTHVWWSCCASCCYLVRQSFYVTIRSDLSRSMSTIHTNSITKCIRTCFTRKATVLCHLDSGCWWTFQILRHFLSSYSVLDLFLQQVSTSICTNYLYLKVTSWQSRVPTITILFPDHCGKQEIWYSKSFKMRWNEFRGILLDYLRNESRSNPNSPIYGKVGKTAIASGHSEGGKFNKLFFRMILNDMLLQELPALLLLIQTHWITITVAISMLFWCSLAVLEIKMIQMKLKSNIHSNIGKSQLCGLLGQKTGEKME